MTKDVLRKLYLGKRAELGDPLRRELSLRICRHFFVALDLSRVKVLHAFLPIEKRHEIDTWPILRQVKEKFPQVRLAIPRVNPDTDTLDHFYFEHEDQLVVNRWGIPEPVTGEPVPLEAIDMVLVPLLVFDRAGHRLGYGRGFYDRFLAGCRSDCQRIGLSWFGPVSRIDDIGEHDIPLHKVITPEGLVNVDG